MLRIYFVLVGIAVVILGLSVPSFAQMKCVGHSGSEHKHGTVDNVSQVTAKKPVEVGNKICPVLGEKIEEKAKATYEYEGKIYNFCCAACIDEFKKDPQKYIKKVEEEKK